MLNRQRRLPGRQRSEVSVYNLCFVEPCLYQDTKVSLQQELGMSKFHLVLLLASGVTLAQTKPAATHKPAAAKATQAAGNPKAIIHTSAGDMRCTLFKEKTPNAVENFIGLATGTKDWTNPVSHAKKHGVPLYDGTVFHRVIPNFMIQGGDPAGNGSGDPGYTFADEIRPELKFDQPGRLAMANSGPNTNGSQFFITEVATPHLNGGYTLFGQCDAATVALVK